MTMNLTKREFIGLAVSTFAAGAFCMEGDAADRGKLSIRFLGTGAADWKKRDSRGEYRRLTSLLLNRKVLVDFTPSNREMMPSECRPSAILYTHSHDDHYNPAAAVSLGISRVYVHESWHCGAVAEFRKASEQMKTQMPEVLPLVIGKAVEVDGMMFTPLPANHVTDRPGELTIMYLIENAGGVRLLYATDTAGIPARALQIIGEKPISALIMEATIGLGHDDDYRIFTHSSVAMVAQTARVLAKTRRYVPVTGRPVFLTHMARTLHGTQKELDASLPKPLCAAYDGMEITL